MHQFHQACETRRAPLGERRRGRPRGGPPGSAAVLDRRRADGRRTGGCSTSSWPTSGGTRRTLTDPQTTLTYIRSRDRLSKNPAYVLKY